MNIELHDPENLLSKNGKKKLRAAIRERWSSEDPDGLLDHIEALLQDIYYEGTIRYDMMRYDWCSPSNCLQVYLERQPDPNSKKHLLRQKLHKAILDRKQGRRSQPDPQWEMYERLRKQIRAQNGSQAAEVIPDPHKVMADLDMFRQLLPSLPPQSAFRTYLQLFF